MEQSATIDLEGELAALERARQAVEDKLAKLAGIAGGGADAVADEYIDAVVAGTIDKLQHELVVFGRIDDEHAWRVGLYGIDSGGEQLVIDWRARFAEAFYQASFDDPRGLARRVSYVGSIDDLLIEEFVTGEVSGSSPLMAELSRSRGVSMKAAVATLQSEQDRLVRLDPTARLVLRGGPGTGKTVVGLHRAAWLVYNDRRVTADRILVVGPSDRFLKFVSAVLPTLGEARITQTTFDRLLGPSRARPGSDERWLDVLDRFEADALPAGGAEGRPSAHLRARRDRAGRAHQRPAAAVARSPAQDLRRDAWPPGSSMPPGEVSDAAAEVWPRMTAKQAMAKLRSRATLEELGADPDLDRRVDGVGPQGRRRGAGRRGAGPLRGRAGPLRPRDRRRGPGPHPAAAAGRDASVDGVTLVGDDAQRRKASGHRPAPRRRRCSRSASSRWRRRTACRPRSPTGSTSGPASTASTRSSWSGSDRRASRSAGPPIVDRGRARSCAAGGRTSP